MNAPAKIGLENWTWYDELGYGICDQAPIDYDADYFDHYRKLDATKFAIKLTKERIRFVKRHTKKSPVDIGIGGGIFCRSMDCDGFDINPHAVEWLKSEGRFTNPYMYSSAVVTCWDSLEHMVNPKELLRMVSQTIFVSIPIFEDEQSCVVSKHFKPGEHIWYFTHEGFIRYMDEAGFKLLEFNNRESILGREGIVSYAFCRYA